MKKGLALAILLQFVISVWLPLQGSASENNDSVTHPFSTVLYVGGDGPNNYSQIQDAVDHAFDGDTVFVFSKSSPYLEHVIVDRSILLIGENRSTTIIDGGGFGDVVLLRADTVTVTGFTVQHGGDLPKVNAGIEARANRSDIHGNIMFQNGRYGVGVLLNHSSEAHVYDNIIVENGNEGVFIGSSTNAIVEHNTMTHNGHCGVVISKSMMSTVVNNTMTDNYAGVSLWPGATHNEIARNVIYDQDYSGIGIWWGADDNFLHDNLLLNNSLYGILITKANRTVITYNTIKRSNEGIRLSMANMSLFQWNNFVENNRSAFFENSSLNRWKQNYWDDHVGVWPECIHGLMRIPWNKVVVVPWLNLDWRPAKQPYTIGKGDGSKDV
ncbi:MAG TPA: NosD domain-containing protein [Candidatus Thermoplasmatota archaeon]|nr:NosD domain-containing protein [Candidatus Thermoplasmatota archaeon]